MVWDGKVVEVVEAGKGKAGCGGLRPSQPPPLRLKVIARLRRLRYFRSASLSIFITHCD